MAWEPQGTPADVQSPTALVLQYLQSKGLQPTAQNVSAALQMNASNPGVIAGLTNQAPPPPDAPMSRGQPQAPQQAPQQQRMPVPPMPPDTPPPPLPPQAGVGPVASGGADAIPAPGQPPAPTDNNFLMQLVTAILGGGAVGGAALGARHLMRPGMSAPPPVSAPVSAPPQATTPQAPPQLAIEGRGNQLRLPAPGIRMPDETSGPTINLGDERVIPPQAAKPQLQIEGRVGDQLRLPPPPIRLQDGTSGPTIPMSDGKAGIPGARAFNDKGVPFSKDVTHTGDNAADIATRQPVKIGGDPQITGQAAKGSGIDWAKILGEGANIAKVAKRVVR